MEEGEGEGEGKQGQPTSEEPPRLFSKIRFRL